MRKNIYLFGALWVLLITTSFSWNYHIVVKNTQVLALNKSQSFFNQILISRMWNSAHNGVYVPVTDQTPPNTYLRDSLRDVTTTSGMQLTKINPAYMTRQIAEISKSRNDFNLRITSLNPIRPENIPDEWEREMLLQLQNEDHSEILKRVSNDSTSMYRYIAPLKTESGCLSCHAHQGYQLGDIRGGISVSFPDEVFIKSQNKQLINLSMAHLSIMLVGLMGISRYFSTTNQFLDKINKKNQQLQNNASLLSQSNEKLAVNLKEKDNFFSLLAHDLKNPIYAMIGLSDILSKDIRNLTADEVESFAKTIHYSASSTFSLLEELLEWGRITQGKITLNPLKVSLITLIENCLRVVQLAANNKDIKLIAEIDQNIFVYTDRLKTETIIRNLITNAIKFTPSSGRIEIFAGFDKDWVVISVSDSGIGMSADQLANLFQLDKLKSEPGTNGEKGTGMGLILCKEIIVLQKGKIWAESKEGEGSIFRFTIPLA